MLSTPTSSALPSPAAALTAVRSAQAQQPSLRCFVEIEDDPAPAGPGALSGLPYAAKDMFDQPGRVAGWGLAARAGRAPAAKAGVLDRLDRAGAVRIGFTTMTALAYEPSGANEEFGRAVNPVNPELISGGSSSGSAVAVAARIVPLAIGSDTGGSLRIPAQACGVVAWKPSLGLIPTDGALALAPSLDTIGFLADGPATLARVAMLFAPDDGRTIARVRVAEDVIGTSDPAIAGAAGNLRDVLDGRGIQMETGDLLPLITRCDGPALAVMQAEAAAQHAGLIAAGGLPPVLTRRLAKGHDLHDAEVAAARAEMTSLRATVPGAWLGRADALLLPVMRMPTPEVATCEPSSPRFSPRTLYELSALTRFVNVLGWPALAVPWGADERGAPIAMQLVGRPGADTALLRLALAIWPLRPGASR